VADDDDDEVDEELGCGVVGVRLDAGKRASAAAQVVERVAGGTGAQGPSLAVRLDRDL